MTSHIEQQVRQRIEAARRKAETDKQRRAELAAARAAGLAARHAQKLQRRAHDNEGTPVVTTPFRSVPCPACRAQRAVRRVGTATVSGSAYEIVRCPQAGCELLWLVRAERPRTAPAAA